MLRLAHFLPAPVHVAGLRLAHAVRKRWWRISGRKVRGCRVLVFDAEERLLLIRHSYGAGHWMLPGGGMERGEDAVTTALREVREETACRIDPALALGLAGDISTIIRHEVHLVAGWTIDSPCADGREIVEAAFFDLASLPEWCSPLLVERLPDYLTRVKAVRPER